MKKLLLIMGDLAAGKSTFAKLLSERYNTIVFSKDTIKEVLGDTIGFSDRQENLKLSGATMELMIFLFSEFGKLGKDLILESNFHAPDVFEDFKAYTEHSRKEEIKGNVITINADDFSYQQDKKLLGKLDEFMEQEDNDDNQRISEVSNDNPKSGA